MTQTVSKVKKWTGIPVKVGLSITKTLAKVAAETVKQRKLKDRYFVIKDIAHKDDILSRFAFGDVWGIGRATSGKLAKIGIKTALDLTKLNDLTSEQLQQPSLFDYKNPKDDKISAIMDQINKKYGKWSIRLAGSGFDSDWKMSRNHLSKRYTSDWNELLDIKP